MKIREICGKKSRKAYIKNLWQFVESVAKKPSEAKALPKNSAAINGPVSVEMLNFVPIFDSLMQTTQHKIELMAPAGSFESLMAGIKGGADSVYFGIEQLNMRARSSSLSESQSSTLQSPVQEISSLAMTPEERRALESEVRAQHNHPLAIRLEQEEAERRMRNEYEYYQQRSANSNRRTIADVRRQGGAAVPLGQQPPLPPRGARELSRLMEAVEHQRNNNVVDFAVLEAALMMSMQEEARRRGEPSSQTGNDFSLDASARVPGRLAAAFHQATVLEEEQLAMAIAASLRESNNDSNHDTNENDNQENNGNDGDDGSDV